MLAFGVLIPSERGRMTVARQVVAGRTYLISRRCTQRQLLLRPEPHVEHIYLYCLAEAAHRYSISLHGFIAMSNHQHILLRDNRGNFPEFLAHLNKMLAKAMNAFRGRFENFWATEQPNAVYLVGAEDRFAKLVYLLANPVADHLVEHVADWPGASSLRMHFSGQPKTIQRPLGYFRVDGNMPDEVRLHLERPDGFEDLSDDQWTSRLRDALAREEARAREERLESNRRVMGRKAVLRALPTDLPTTVAPRRELRPHLACGDKERRRSELRNLMAFRQERQRAVCCLLRGETDVVFPFGTYRVRGFFISAPPPTVAVA